MNGRKKIHMTGLVFYWNVHYIQKEDVPLLTVIYMWFMYDDPLAHFSLDTRQLFTAMLLLMDR